MLYGVETETFDTEAAIQSLLYTARGARVRWTEEDVYSTELDSGGKLKPCLSPISLIKPNNTTLGR